ncbi:hypothetical protein BS47DRAFT_1388222 [Hydnum rufescens UP504]|uniref:MutS protein homolog 3 n=1 Tax=Hydnum rufescens UP504 TaxID=1448309 RepID=A0A9P6BAS8_9AGAM|nr:hypothetical protein BS47DRAFT_1388222 [Hydnum rufescens UP504]
MPQQSTISSFFKPTQSAAIPKRRAHSPIDLTGNEDEEMLGVTNARPSKKSRVSSDASSSSKVSAPAPQPAERRPRVYTSGDPSPPIIVTEPNGRPETSRPAIDARRKWALSEIKSSTFAMDTTDEEEAKARKARRRAFAAKLSIRTSTRDQHHRDLEQVTSGPTAPLQGDEEEELSGPLEEDDCLMDIDADDQDNSHRKTSSTISKKKAVAMSTSARGKGKSKVEIGPSGQSYTPLEKQEAHPGVILLIEVGYKYRFFGEDARVASKELGIGTRFILDFTSPRLTIFSSLFSATEFSGHKVGIVGQAETAALKKVSENKSGPFERKLTHLYTSATFVDDLDSVDDDGYTSPSASNALVCLVEKLLGGMGADERVIIGLISIIPSTGDVVYDEFQGALPDSMSQLTSTYNVTRMTHIKPCELLLPSKKLSNGTKKMLIHFTNTPYLHQHPVKGPVYRIEEFPKLMDYSDAFDFLTEFYSSESKKGAADVSEAFKSGKLMATIVDLPKTAVVALAHTIKYLTEFDLGDVFVQTSMFTKFTTEAHMLLNGNTLSNLQVGSFLLLDMCPEEDAFREIYRNQTDFTEKGSLLWILDRTKTRFGARLLKTWIGRPLVDRIILQERLDAVEEIVVTQSHTLDRLRTLIRRLPDLVKGLCRVQYGKCTPKELAILLEAYTTIAKTFDPDRERCGGSGGAINLQKARSEENSELWVDDDKYPTIQNTKLGILSVESELEEELKSIRKILQRPTLKWVHVNHDEYTVEVSRTSIKDVPASWMRKSSTKAVVRFHTPEVRKLLTEREQLKETLAVECDKAFANFLVEVSGHYAAFRDCTNKIAIFDCLNSLALVASEDGYVKPEFVDEDVLDISRGRHPMVELLRPEPFVPNNVTLGGFSPDFECMELLQNHPRHKIITGPNMGGKSSCVRMTALIAIMAQIGSYVPAQKARLGLHNAILTRMGASDELARGWSTFMVEISETCDIIKSASPRTLVILDELGRGTSTFDGMSIAFAVLQHLVETVKCKTLFITHYPLLASEMGKLPEVNNGHMGFVEEKRSDGTLSINFLYRLSPGMARGSFGIECAQLAGMPEQILVSARTHSKAMEEVVDSRRVSNRSRKTLSLIRDCVGGSSKPQPATGITGFTSTCPADGLNGSHATVAYTFNYARTIVAPANDRY